MTAQQAMRYERRRQRELEQRKQFRDTITAILVILFILAAFALAGAMDYQDEMNQLAYWAERGVTIQRW